MKSDNPFSLTFGMPPYTMIGRFEEKDRVISTFTADNAVSHVYLIEGIRGSGKTVLMTSISEELCKRKDWVGVDLNPSIDLLQNLCDSLRDAAFSPRDLVDQGFNVSVAGFGVGIGSTQRPKSVNGEIEDMLQKLQKQGRNLIITIDEVSSGQNVRVFASQFQIFLRKRYPVFLLMTGLYENIYSIQNDDALTFLLRSPKIRVGSLSLMQIAMQYETIFSTDSETASRMAGETKGYAFAFQAFGMLVWEKGISAFRENAAELYQEYDSLLDDFAYRKIWSGLTQKEQKFILALQETGNTRVSEISAATGASGSSVSQYKERLISKGVLVNAGFGLVETALPRFRRICGYYHLISSSDENQ